MDEGPKGAAGPREGPGTAAWTSPSDRTKTSCLLLVFCPLNSFRVQFLTLKRGLVNFTLLILYLLELELMSKRNN